MQSISKAFVAAVGAIFLALPADAATINYVSGALVGPPVSASINVTSSMPSGHTITGGKITVNFLDDYSDHYFFQTQYAGGNEYNFVYLDPAETAKLTIGGKSYQASSPYEYVRYLSRIVGGTAYYDVVDGYQGNFSITALLAQDDIDGLNATGSLAFLVSALLGNFNLVDANLTLNTTALNVAATPIPGALPLFASAMGIVAWVARRRKRSIAA